METNNKTGQGELESLFDDNIEGDSEFTQKRPREANSNDEDDLFDNIEEDDNQSQRRRLKKKKKGSESQKGDHDDIEVEKAPEREKEDEQERDRDNNDENERDDDDDDEELNKPVGSKQLQSELFADDSDSENIVSGSELPNDFPDDLSDDEIIGIQADDENAANRNRDQQQQAYVSDEDFSDEERLGDFVVDAFGNPVRVAKENQRRMNPGAITSEQLVVAHDIFGDYPGEEDDLNDQYGEQQEEDDNMFLDFQGKASDLRKESYKILAKRLEPSELEENFASERDDDIVNLDVPERHQLSTPSREVPDEEAIIKEAEWIYNNVFRDANPSLNLEQDVVINCIKSVLKFILVEHLEIPFIATYRKEHWNTCSPTDDFVEGNSLVMTHLWDIYDWDQKWFHFQNKKNKLIKLYSTLAEEHLEKIPEDHISECIAAINHVVVPEELNDYFDHYGIHFSQFIQNTQRSNSSQKLPSKRDAYSIAKRAGGVAEFAEAFGLSAREFGINLEQQNDKYIPKDPDVSPLDMAFVSTNDIITKKEDLLEAAKVFLATEIGVEPRVRQYLRSQFNVYAVLNTRPTEEGKRVIDAFHSCRDVKHLKDKPILEIIQFESPTTKFAKILKAAKEGLITFTVDLPLTNYNKIFNDTKRYFLSRRNIDNEWNRERESILEMAFSGHLLPLFRNQLIEKLSTEGQLAVVSIIENNLEKLLLAGPFKVNQEIENEEEQDTKDLKPNNPYGGPISVLSCCYGSYTDHKATECVLLTGGGEYKAHITLAFTPKTNERDLQQFREFIETHNPTVIALGTNGYSSRHLYAEMMALLRNMKEQGFKVPHATWVDSEVSEIYWSTKQAKDEFKKLNISKTGTYNPRIARAISIGRRLQDPLIEFARICNNKKDITCLNLHPLQEIVNSELLYTRLERVFVSIVNAVGVDINELLREPKKSHILSFVCGLGPRKAAHILSEISSTTSIILSRAHLAKYMGGEIVGRNALGFIKINVEDIKKKGNGDWPYEILDSTRIHPEDYNFALKIAKDAIEREDCDNYVEEIMKNPEELDSLDLDLFAQLLDQNFNQKKLHVLYDIKNELTSPFTDCRESYCDLDVDHLFDLLTGTTNDTLYSGMFVKCRIIMRNDRDYSRGVSCQLEHSEIMGWIPKEWLSDDRQVETACDVVQNDETVLGRIVNVEKSKFRVTITCRPSDLLPQRDDDKYQYHHHDRKQLFATPNRSYDKYLIDDPAEDYINPALEEKTEEMKPKEAPVLKRAIVHPKFKNIDSKTAISELGLDTVPQGHFLFRPSSRDYNHLSISWKFFSDIFVHIEIREEQKPNNWSLGKKLFIGKDKYDDLDDIVANFLGPLVGYAESVFDHRRFKAGKRSEIDAFLGDAKKQNENEMAYVIAVSYEDPGRFLLCYLPYKKIVREFITVTPKGLRYRQKYFKSAERVVNYFKGNWKNQEGH